MVNQIQTRERTRPAYWKLGYLVLQQKTHEQTSHLLIEIIENNLSDQQRRQILVLDNQRIALLRVIHRKLHQTFLQHKLTRSAGLASPLKWTHPTLPNKVPQPG